MATIWPPQNRKNPSEQICPALRAAILEREVLPGMKLPKDALGARFGASHTIVRQALERLTAEGPVELCQNRRVAVVSPSLEEARDLFALRVQVEDLVIVRLASGLTATQEATLAAQTRARRRQKMDLNPRPSSLQRSSTFSWLN